MKLSACLIVKNEEANMAACLQSLVQSVDEIIVVDTGSTDKTKQIAKQCGAKVYEYAWTQDFSAAKNFALAKASGNWILFPDADEFFSDATRANIRKLITKYGKQYDALLVRMLNIDPDQENKLLDYFYPVRIFKNDKGIRYEGKIHEELARQDKKKIKAYQLQPTELEMIHTGYASSLMQAKSERNLPLLLAQLAHDPQNPSLHAYLSDCYFTLADYARAIQHARLAIASNSTAIGYISRIYRRLIKALQCSGADQAEIKATMEAAMRRFPAMPDFHCEYALHAAKYGNYEEAIELLEKADDLAARYHDAEPSFYAYLAPQKEKLHAALYECKNDAAKLIDYNRNLLMKDKFDVTTFQALLQLYRREDPARTIAFLNQIYSKDDSSDLRFLIKHLQKYCKNALLAYYMSAEETVERTPYKESLAFCCTGRYDLASQCLLRSMRPYSPAAKFSLALAKNMRFLTACLLAAKDPLAAASAKPMLAPRYWTIIERFFAQAPPLTQADQETYLEICGELSSFNQEILNTYLACATDFPSDFLLRLTQTLLESALYLQAASLAETVVNRQDASLAAAAEKAAYACYKSSQYGKAKTYYEAVLRHGAEDIAAKQYYDWSCDRL